MATVHSDEQQQQEKQHHHPKKSSSAGLVDGMEQSFFQEYTIELKEVGRPASRLSLFGGAAPRRIPRRASLGMKPAEQPPPSPSMPQLLVLSTSSSEHGVDDRSEISSVSEPPTYSSACTYSSDEIRAATARFERGMERLRLAMSKVQQAKVQVAESCSGSSNTTTVKQPNTQHNNDDDGKMSNNASSRRNGRSSPSNRSIHGRSRSQHMRTPPPLEREGSLISRKDQMQVEEIPEGDEKQGEGHEVPAKESADASTSQEEALANRDQRSEVPTTSAHGSSIDESRAGSPSSEQQQEAPKGGRGGDVLSVSIASRETTAGLSVSSSVLLQEVVEKSRWTGKQHRDRKRKKGRNTSRKGRERKKSDKKSEKENNEIKKRKEGRGRPSSPPNGAERDAQKDELHNSVPEACEDISALEKECPESPPASQLVQMTSMQKMVSPSSPMAGSVNTRLTEASTSLEGSSKGSKPTIDLPFLPENFMPGPLDDSINLCLEGLSSAAFPTPRMDTVTPAVPKPQQGKDQEEEDALNEASPTEGKEVDEPVEQEAEAEQSSEPEPPLLLQPEDVLPNKESPTPQKTLNENVLEFRRRCRARAETVFSVLSSHKSPTVPMDSKLLETLLLPPPSSSASRPQQQTPSAATEEAEEKTMEQQQLQRPRRRRSRSLPDRIASDDDLSSLEGCQRGSFRSLYRDSSSSPRTVPTSRSRRSSNRHHQRHHHRRRRKHHSHGKEGKKKYNSRMNNEPDTIIEEVDEAAAAATEDDNSNEKLVKFAEQVDDDGDNNNDNNNTTTGQKTTTTTSESLDLSTSHHASIRNLIKRRRRHSLPGDL